VPSQGSSALDGQAARRHQRRAWRPLGTLRRLALALLPLVALLAVARPAGAVTKAPGGYLWGVDSVEPAAANLRTIQSHYGATPAFWGRYISDCGPLCGGNLSTAEVSQDHGAGLNLLLLVADRGGSDDQGAANGTDDAHAAVAAARADGAPAAVAIFKDFEASSSPDPAFIESWYDTVAAAGFAPGFYENSYTEFASAYCAAVRAQPRIGTSYLYASENEPGPASSPPGSAPPFSDAAFPSCPGDHAVWQYTESDDGGVDEDLASPATPMWGPDGLAVYEPPAPPSLILDPGSLGSTGGTITITASDPSPVTSYTYSSSPGVSGSSSCRSATCQLQIPPNLSLDTVEYTLSVTATDGGGTSVPATVTLDVYGLTQTVQSQLPGLARSTAGGPVSGLGSALGPLASPLP
jgi:hypothetical protein